MVPQGTRALLHRRVVILLKYKLQWKECDIRGEILTIEPEFKVGGRSVLIEINNTDITVWVDHKKEDNLPMTITNVLKSLGLRKE
jgi:hypothetical protein